MISPFRCNTKQGRELDTVNPCIRAFMRHPQRRSTFDKRLWRAKMVSVRTLSMRAARCFPGPGKHTSRSLYIIQIFFVCSSMNPRLEVESLFPVWLFFPLQIKDYWRWKNKYQTSEWLWMSARQREYLRSLSDAEMLSVTDLDFFS